jgi:hypothetical protein
MGNLTGAREAVQRGLELAEAQAKTEPHEAEDLRGLLIALTKLGDVEREAGDLEAVRHLVHRRLEVAEALARADPDDGQATFEVVLALQRIATLAKQERDNQALRDAVTTANRHLTKLEAKGQLDGVPKREAARDFFRREAERLGREP